MHEEHPAEVHEALDFAYDGRVEAWLAKYSGDHKEELELARRLRKAEQMATKTEARAAFRAHAVARDFTALPSGAWCRGADGADLTVYDLFGLLRFCSDEWKDRTRRDVYSRRELPAGARLLELGEATAAAE